MWKRNEIGHIFVDSVGLDELKENEKLMKQVLL